MASHDAAHVERGVAVGVRAWLRRVFGRREHFTVRRDAAGNVTAIAYGKQPISQAQLEADIARMEEYARETVARANDDVTYRSRED